MTTKLILLLVENGCKDHVSDDEFCKAATQFSSSSNTESEANDVALYTQNIVVIKRSDIELKQRDEHFEIKACLEDYHIDNINDYIESKMDDHMSEEEEPIYILHEICDHIDDIKKLNATNFVIRASIHICDTQPTEQKLSTNKDENKETETDNQTDESSETQKINISEKIMQHFMDETNYEKYECLDDIILHKIAGYKDAIEICGELRIFIHRIQTEWHLYDANWRNDKLIPTIKIPATGIQLKDINEYDIYNKCVNNIQSPDISSILCSMIEQITNDEHANDTQLQANEEPEQEPAAGVYRFGDMFSQNHYLNKVDRKQMESNQKIMNECSECFIRSLFGPYSCKQMASNARIARYTFSKLNPLIFDDALICKQLPIGCNEWVFREDLNKMGLFQRIQNLNNNPFIKCNQKYLSWMDAVILMYCEDNENDMMNASNISVFLSSNIGFREWMKLPQKLKNIKPNTFYESKAAKQSHFLYNNTISIYPPFYNNWFMGISSFDNKANSINNRPYLWLRNNGLNGENCVLSISKNIHLQKSVNFSVNFPDNAQLSFTSKSIINTVEKVENVENAENVENTESVEHEARERCKDNIIFISLPNEITVEYHCKTGELIMFYQSAFKQYQIQKQKQPNQSEPPSNEPTNEEEKEEDDVEDEDEKPPELESIDVSWHNIDNNSNVFVVWRSIDCKGIITIFYSDDSQRKLFPNSEIWYKSSKENDKWIIIKSNGECSINNTETKKPINIATTTDSETDTKIVTREDNVLVFCHSNGDGFIQYPDSSHIFVKSNISKKEWDIYTLSEWMQSMGVDKESSFQISNVSQNIVQQLQTAEKVKPDPTEIRFELKNDCKMPTVIVDKINNNTQVMFYNGFNATFAHPNMSENVVSSIHHKSTGKFLIYNDTESKDIHFLPKDTDSVKIPYNINLNDENPFISIEEYKIELNGEYNTNDTMENKKLVKPLPRVFVVCRDGNGYELLSKDTFSEFCDYLKNCEPHSQILEAKELSTSDTSDGPSVCMALSHRFIMERFANNAPRQEINVPSVLCQTLKTKLNTYQDNESNRSCSIYRHILEAKYVITPTDIERAENDLLDFENWLESNENKLKLENSPEINEINQEMIEQRNKLKQETNLSSLELKLTLTSELQRSKLDALNKKLQTDKPLQENKDLINKNEDICIEREEKAREIKNIQKESEEKNRQEILEQENVSYFENGAFLRDYEIHQQLLEIFGYFIKIWNENQAQNEEKDKLFISTLSLLQNVCKRLREIISMKTLKTLRLNEEIMIKMKKNEFIANHIDNLLCSIGFTLSAVNDKANGYIPQQSNIFIDAGICNILAKLDEYHSKYKKYLFKVNDKNIDYIKSFETDYRKSVNKKGAPRKVMKCNENKNVIDTPYIAASQSPSPSPASHNYHSHTLTHSHSDNKHCSCCPIDSPKRATKMDYLGRNRKNVISMNELENYSTEVSDIQLNSKYIETEGSVQQRVRTTSTFPRLLSSKDAFPTIVIQPHCIDFGDILIGYIYRFTASITNHGHSQARFKIDIEGNNNPDIHIKPYYRAGGIAPGITIMLEIEFYAKRLKAGKYANRLKIKTQKHIFNVNIKANIIEDSYINPVNNNNKKSRVTCLGKKY